MRCRMMMKPNWTQSGKRLSSFQAPRCSLICPTTGMFEGTGKYVTIDADTRTCKSTKTNYDGNTIFCSSTLSDASSVRMRIVDVGSSYALYVGIARPNASHDNGLPNTGLGKRSHSQRFLDVSRLPNCL